MKKFFKEFKEFITRGNVLDMAVGIIIGSAFTAIITAVVSNILTPLINWIPGADGTGALQVVLRQAVTDAEGNITTEALIIDFGAVISAVITFLITALVLFVIVKAINTMRARGEKLKEGLKKKAAGEDKPAAPAAEEAPAASAAPAAPAVTTETLLAEIRDLLKEQSAAGQAKEEEEEKK